MTNLHQKYDTSMEHQITLYDHLPYQRNIDLCNSDSISLYSGHVIKYFLCIESKKPYIISNHDQAAWEAQEKKDIETNISRVISMSSPQNITDAQIAALTEDRPNINFTQENDILSENKTSMFSTVNDQTKKDIQNANNIQTMTDIHTEDDYPDANNIQTMTDIQAKNEVIHTEETADDLEEPETINLDDIEDW
jgi:hypothetical protein